MRVRWQARASRDLDAIVDHILADNPQAAAALYRRIVDRVRQLEHHPNLGRPGHVAGTRELVVTGTPYIVYYRVQGQTAHILPRLPWCPPAAEWAVGALTLKLDAVRVQAPVHRRPRRIRFKFRNGDAYCYGANWSSPARRTSSPTTSPPSAWKSSP